MKYLLGILILVTMIPLVSAADRMQVNSFSYPSEISINEDLTTSVTIESIVSETEEYYAVVMQIEGAGWVVCDPDAFSLAGNEVKTVSLTCDTSSFDLGEDELMISVSSTNPSADYDDAGDWMIGDSATFIEGSTPSVSLIGTIMVLVVVAGLRRT